MLELFNHQAPEQLQTTGSSYLCQTVGRGGIHLSVFDCTLAHEKMTTKKNLETLCADQCQSRGHLTNDNLASALVLSSI